MEIEDIQSRLQDHTGVVGEHVSEDERECLGKEVCRMCRSEYQPYDNDLNETCLSCAAEMDGKLKLMTGNLPYLLTLSRFNLIIRQKSQDLHDSQNIFPEHEKG